MRKHGVAGAVRTAARSGWEHLLQFLRTDELYVWYELKLASVPPTGELDGIELRPAVDGDREAIAEVPYAHTARWDEFGAEGGQPWLASAEGLPAFTCWIFRHRMPILHWVDLPSRVAGLEYSATSPRVRGRGVAPNCWGALATMLREEGFESLITKVEKTNTPSRRAVTKAGFEEFAEMATRRRLGRWSGQMVSTDGRPELARRLTAAVHG